MRRKLPTDIFMHIIISPSQFFYVILVCERERDFPWRIHEGEEGTEMKKERRKRKRGKERETNL